MGKPISDNPLTEKQKRFVDEYESSGSARSAALEICEEVRECAGGTRGRYVYALVDGRDDSIFYVGKGKGRRAEDHVRNRMHCTTNAVKRNRIMSVLAAGSSVGIVIIEDGLTDDAACRSERSIIRRWRDRLSNVSGGSIGPFDTARAEIAVTRRALGDRRLWVALFNPNRERVALRDWVEAKLDQFAAQLEEFERNGWKIA